MTKVKIAPKELVIRKQTNDMDTPFPFFLFYLVLGRGLEEVRVEKEGGSVIHNVDSSPVTTSYCVCPWFKLNYSLLEFLALSLPLHAFGFQC
jgi:hypothetical protein